MSVKESQIYQNAEEALQYKGSGWLKDILSAGSRPIVYKHLKAKDNAKRILLIGGVHGNETEGVRFMKDFCDEFATGEASPFGQELFVIPVLNPDGFLNYERKNNNGVDLNRNLPTKDWSAEFKEDKYFPGKTAGSEPENQFLAKVIADFKPDYVISFHSWKPMININGPAKPFAEAMNTTLKMIITDDIGYPTPGSLGTYTGWEQNIPTITLEFERGIDLDSVYPYAREGILESFKLLG